MAKDTRQLLFDAGLDLLGVQTHAGKLTPIQAWMMVIGGAVIPDHVIDDQAENYLDNVNSKWLEVANRRRLLDPDRTFLISLSRPGTREDPWFHVRISGELRMAQVLAPQSGEPEYVTASLTGYPIIGVTAEEYEAWIVLLESDSPTG